jgi:hypothetical protein
MITPPPFDWIVNQIPWAVLTKPFDFPGNIEDWIMANIGGLS